MKWLILTPDAKHADLNHIESVLTKDCALTAQVLPVHSGLSDTELTEAVDAIVNATHFVVIGTDELCSFADGTYLLGMLMGRNVPVFVCAKTVPLFAGVRANASRFKVFSDIQLTVRILNPCVNRLFRLPRRNADCHCDRDALLFKGNRFAGNRLPHLFQ